jgi:predicted phosphodiesterase
MPGRITRRSALTQAACWAVSPALLSPVAQSLLAADPAAESTLVDGPLPRPAKDSFTVAVLPDTQNYSERFPELFLAQTQWLVENREDRNIAAVLHLGDITNRNLPEQWQNAQKAMNQLDGHLPYFMVPGNHDYSDNGSCQDRTTLLNEYFPVAKFKETPNFAAVYDKESDRMENNCQLFSAGGRNFVVIGLEFGPRKDVVRWANEMAEKYKDREAILITHAFIYSDETRYDWAKYGTKQTWNPHSYPIAKNTGDDVMDGEELWQNLVSKHENFILTLSGHVLHDGLGRVVTATPGGREVPQCLVNFQMKPRGGDGWLRLLEFRPDGKTVQVYDYSPTLNKRNTSSQNEFELKLAPIG